MVKKDDFKDAKASMEMKKKSKMHEKKESKKAEKKEKKGDCKY